MIKLTHDDMVNTVTQGDCLELIENINPGSVDMVLCDLPYGTTACKWDTRIPLDALWRGYKKVLKSNGVIVLTASQPFTSILITSNLQEFKYCLVWDKVNKYTGALDANRKPLKRHEDIAIFYSSQPIYNKQYRTGNAYKVKRTKGHGQHTFYGAGTSGEVRYGENDGKHHNPCSVLQIPADNKVELGLHPTQKPVALFEYLIRTYTNPGALVLDNCCGSGTTGIACLNSGRNFIQIEREEAYCNIALERIGNWVPPAPQEPPSK